jgi:hypothetical protein
MLTMRSVSMAAAVLVGAIVAWQAVPAQAQNVPNGSYRQSCREIRMEGRDDLVATCRRVNGNWRYTKIDIDRCRGRDITNDNGRLRCGDGGDRYRMPRGSWTQSCRNADIRGDDLYAQCRGRDGRWHNTRIDLDRCPGRGLMNDNGELRCT